jgi:urea transporter
MVIVLAVFCVFYLPFKKSIQSFPLPLKYTLKYIVAAIGMLLTIVSYPGYGTLFNKLFVPTLTLHYPLNWENVGAALIIFTFLWIIVYGIFYFIERGKE